MYPVKQVDPSTSSAPSCSPFSASTTTIASHQIDSTDHHSTTQSTDQMGFCFSKPVLQRSKKKKIVSGRRTSKHVPQLSTIPERSSTTLLAPRESEDFPPRQSDTAGTRLAKFGNASIANFKMQETTSATSDCPSGEQCPFFGGTTHHDEPAADDPFSDFDTDSGGDQVVDEDDSSPDLKQVVSDLLSGSQKFAIHVDSRIFELQSDIEALKDGHDIALGKAKEDGDRKEKDIMTLMRLVNRVCEKCDFLEGEVRRMRRVMGMMSSSRSTISRESSRED